MAKPPFLPIPESIRPIERIEPVGGERLAGTEKTPGHEAARTPPHFSHQTPTIRRYSSYIRLMKLLLPATAAALLGLVVTWPQIQSVPTRFTMGFANIGDSLDKKPRMIHARFTGSDTKGRPYSLTAENVSQVSDTSEIVALDRPQADFTLANGSWVVLSSLSGIYSENTKILGLRESVNLFHDLGYEFHTSSADIDLSSRTATGGTPITGQGPFGQVSSQGFRILDEGSKIIFTGKTKLVIFAAALEGSK